MEKVGAADRELEHLFDENKRKRNPLVPFAIQNLEKLMGNHVSFSLLSGAFVTAGVLTAGGNSELGQKLMRARVVEQGATVAIMLGTAYYYGN